MRVHQSQARVLLLAAVFLIPSLALADQDTVSLDQLISELLQNNPQIQAADSKYQAALAKPSQERTLP
ncbi:hypothetical protein L0244_23540, partial [bacterium]|nr:hypothetical protein [bacterium]